MHSGRPQDNIHDEQEHVPPQMPENPEALEVEKQHMAKFIPVVVIVLAIVFVIIAIAVV